MAIVYQKQHIKTKSHPSSKMSTCNGQDLTSSKVTRKASKREAKKTSVTLTQPKENGQNVVGKFLGKILGRSKSRKDTIKQTNPLEVSKTYTCFEMFILKILSFYRGFSQILYSHYL